MKQVLVTGANGHVGGALVKLLAERGYKVRASVRDAGNAEKTRVLKQCGAEVVQADLMQPDSLARALEGMDGLFQVAAVYATVAKDPQREIIDPSIIGGMNALKAASTAGVKKVVFTSSVAAVGTDAPPEKPLTEEDWNDRAVAPYFIAKTKAERAAWDFAKSTGMNLVVINPCAVIGPGFNRHTPSTQFLEELLRGRLPMVLPLGFSFVDVRDVAMAHLLAYEKSQASGRYIVADRFFTMRELMLFLREMDPALAAPTRVAPRALLPALPMLDWLGNKVLGAPRQISQALVAELGGKYQRVSAERIRRDLGWTPMDFTQSIRDTLDWIRRTFMRRKENGDK